MIKTIAFTAYTVADLGRAITFYRDALGLGEPSVLSARWAEFDIGGTTFALIAGSDWFAVPPGSAFSIAFETDNLDAAIDRLTSHGGDIEGPPLEEPTCRAVFARDPDGNRFALHQLKPEE